LTLPFKVVTLSFTLLLPLSSMQRTPRFVSFAIPFFFSSMDYNILFLLYVFQAELLDPVVKGTLNVLKSCVKSPTLKRIVLTSSIAAVAFTDRPKNPNPVVEESWYSDPEFCKRRGYVSFPLINFHYKLIFDETSLENHTNSK